MHSRIFNVVPVGSNWEKLNEDDVFDVMNGRADYVVEMNESDRVSYEMDYLLKVLKEDLPNVTLNKNSEGNYILRLSMKELKDKINRFDGSLNDRCGYLFMYQLNLPFTELEWFYYLLSRYSEDAVIEFMVVQVFDYHF